MHTLESLSGSYGIKGIDPDFSLGRRSPFRYAIPSKLLTFCNLNEDGPEPTDYIKYAKADLSHRNQRGRINSLGHAKRAIHLIIDQLFYAFGLSRAFERANFPEKLALLKDINAFPTHILNQLNYTRNLIEHEHKDIAEEEAIKFTEIAEMFILLIYPYFKNIVKAAYIGIDNDNRCFEYEISQKKAKIFIQEVKAPLYLNSPHGRIYYNIEHKHDRVLLDEFEIAKSNSSRWLPYIDLFIYWTKRSAVKLPRSEDGPGGRIWESHIAHLI